MSNVGVSFDSSLIQSDTQSNASIAGVPFRINPNQISLSFKVKSNILQTVGGFVYQIYGVEWSDLIVSGQFGAGGWQEQSQFFQYVYNLVGTTVHDQSIQTPSGGAIEPDGSFRFMFPLLGYDFHVLLTAYASQEGQAVLLDNRNINPTWTLTMTIDQDHSNLTKLVTDQYINRLRAGIGYMPNQFNGPTTSSTFNVQQFLQNYAASQPLSSFLSGAFGQSANGSTSTLGSATSANIVGNTNAQKVFNYFVGQGLTAAAAAGFVGNFMQESSCNPESVQSGGPGRGLAQWSVGGRWQTYLMTGNESADLAAQLAYAWQELTSSYSYVLNAVKSLNDVTNATTIIMNEYEAPAASSADLNNRISYAQSALAMYGTGVGNG